MHPVALGRVELERADAFDGDLAALALRSAASTKPVSSAERAAAVRPLEADEKLVAARRRLADGQHDAAVAGSLVSSELPEMPVSS